MNLIFTHSWIFQNFLNWRNRLFEHIHAQLFKFGSCNCHCKILGLCKRIDFNWGLSRWTENSFSLFTLSSESSQSSSILFNIDSFLFFELGYTIVNQFIVKIFTSQVSITSSGLYLKNSIVNSQERNIECSTSQVKN